MHLGLCHHLAKTVGFPSLATEGGKGADNQRYTAGGGVWGFGGLGNGVGSVGWPAWQPSSSNPFIVHSSSMNCLIFRVWKAPSPGFSGCLREQPLRANADFLSIITSNYVVILNR